MSMPVTLSAPSTPASSTTTELSNGSGELFGAVLSGLSGGDPDGSADNDTAEESLDAMSAAAAAPFSGALLAGLNFPIADARTLPTATGSAGVRTAEAATTPMGGTVVPAQLGATTPGQPVTFAVPGQPTGNPVPGLPSQVLPVAVALNGPAPLSTPQPSTVATPPVAPVAGAPSAVYTAAPAAATTPVMPAAQAVAGAAAAAGLTGTLAGSVAGATARTTAPGAPGVAAPEPVIRTTGTQNAITSTVDTGVPAGTGSTVETAVRSGNAFADANAGQDRGDGALPRGPEAGWAPALAAARADGAAPTTPAAAPPTAQPHLPPAAQLALRLAPLRSGPDGTHQLTILLNPEELGPVSVVATVKGDQLSVQLTGATEAGREAMRAALPQLERDLRDGGFATLALNVRDAPRPETVRPAWAATAAPTASPAQPVAQPAAPQPTAQPARPAQGAQRAQPAQPPGAATPVAPTATEYATDGTVPATAPTKNDSQPIGQIAHPEGSGSIRRDDGTGQYSPAVAAAAQTPGSQFGNTGQQQSSPQSSQLNLGQPGGQSGQQPNHPGLADQQQHGGGRHSGPEYDTPTGRTGPGESDPRAAEHRATPGRSDAGPTENRSVDLRV